MKKSKDKANILLVYRTLNSFVKRDSDILNKQFNVRNVKWGGKKTIPKIISTIFNSDLTFSWFASDYAAVTVFFSKVFGKKSVIIIGGFDAAYVPEIKYGQFTLTWHKRLLSKFAIKYADIVFPVSNFTKEDMLKKINPKKFKIIYNGVDTNIFKPKGNKIKNLVITVGGIKWNNLKRKGIETFVKSARYLPDSKFVVIGKIFDDSIKYLESIAPSNVEFTGFVSEKDLLEWYQKASVICQLSYYEAFGLAPAEGMACGCIPVVTKERSGMPEFVNDCGFYVKFGDEKQTAETIKKAFDSSEYLRKKSIDRIKDKFSLEKRREKLLKEIKKLVNN